MKEMAKTTFQRRAWLLRNHFNVLAFPGGPSEYGSNIDKGRMITEYVQAALCCRFEKEEKQIWIKRPFIFTINLF